MKNKHKAGLSLLLLFGLAFMLVMNANMRLKAESEEVLDGLEGVERVYSHFIGSKEAHTVYYDPASISVEQMENALEDGAGYLETVN